MWRSHSKRSRAFFYFSKKSDSCLRVSWPGTLAFLITVESWQPAHPCFSSPNPPPPYSLWPCKILSLPPLPSINPQQLCFSWVLLNWLTFKSGIQKHREWPDGFSMVNCIPFFWSHHLFVLVRKGLFTILLKTFILHSPWHLRQQSSPADLFARIVSSAHK